jgi:hypothetical protein
MQKFAFIFMVLVGFMGSGAQAQMKSSDELVIGVQPDIQSPKLPVPKTLDEAKKQIAVLQDAISSNHILWSIHCKNEEDRLIHYFAKTQNQNHTEASKKSSGGSSAKPKAVLPAHAGESSGAGEVSGSGSGK